LILLGQETADLLHIDRVIEWSGVANLAFVRRKLEFWKNKINFTPELRSSKVNLSLQAFDQMADGHATGHCVWVDDDVRGYAFSGKWHVLL
jgi:hypothetical protein